MKDEGETGKSDHLHLGEFGEDVAARMLIREGYSIVARNWHFGHLEIDIIAENEKDIVFVEVKTRSSLYGGHEPYEAVNANKQRKLMKAINAYIKSKNIEKTPRFDIIGIQVTHGSLVKSSHLVDVFTPFNVQNRPPSFHWGKRKG